MREVVFDPTSVTSFSVYEFGDGQGPSIAITAGVHGDEQTAIYTANLLIKALSNHAVRGRIKVIPICNPAAYRNRTRYSPFDHLDMNRVFPGNVEGSPTLQLAHQIWEETRDVEYLLDLHCCGVDGSTYTLALYEEYPELRRLAGALGIPVVIQSGGKAGQLFIESCHAGQKALIIELPGGQPGGMIDLKAAEECCEAVIRYLTSLGSLKGDQHDSVVTFYGKITTLSAPHPGLFIPAATSGTYCQKGDLLGTLEGKPVTAPFTCVITNLSLARYCFAGERLAGVAPLELS